ncbi:MAG: hypothetical protein ACK5TA_04285, partial [bacterium]
MKFRLIITFLIFASHLANADEKAEQAIAAAKRAMENDLWDVATSKLQATAELPNLPLDTRSEILIMLVESYIRSDQTTKALSLLEQPSVANLPETPFWRGLALAGSGRFNEAAESLAIIAGQPNHP